MVLTGRGTVVATSFLPNAAHTGDVVRMIAEMTPALAIQSFFLEAPLEVSAILAGADGGVIINYSDGTMGGPDPGYAQMHLTKAQPADAGTWLGKRNSGLVDELGPSALENPTAFSQGSGMIASNAVSPTCPQGDPDLNDLVSEYPYVPSHGKRVWPKCDDFKKEGTAAAVPSRHFPWGQLSGRSLQDNDHLWAIVKDKVRNGLDLTYDNFGGTGINLTSAYRSPKLNASIPGAVNSGHIWGVGADMKPKGSPTYLLRAVWDRLLQAAVDAGAVWEESWNDNDPRTQTHVHGNFEWWPGRKEYDDLHP